MLNDGYQILQIELPSDVRSFVMSEDWPQLDRVMKVFVQEKIKPLLQTFKTFNDIEHMIALREGNNPEEEDGIWHDDGSRVLAFSLSLNFFGMPEGGTLGIRPRGIDEGIELGPYEPGTLIVFQTGIDGFEHRTARVTKGRRLVCAGWCS